MSLSRAARVSLALALALVVSLGANLVLVRAALQYFKSATLVRLDPVGLRVHAGDRAAPRERVHTILKRHVGMGFSARRPWHPSRIRLHTDERAALGVPFRDCSRRRVGASSCAHLPSAQTSFERLASSRRRGCPRGSRRLVHRRGAQCPRERVRRGRPNRVHGRTVGHSRDHGDLRRFHLPQLRGQEPFGLVFLDAMAMQRPVVAISNGGTTDVVEHGRSGLLSPAQNVEALAGNIVALLKDGELRARMGAYGRFRVLKYFDAQRMARDAGSAYESILNQ